MSGSGMHHQTLGLVDDQHILVFIDDIQIHFGRRNIHSLRLRNLVGDLIANIQLVIFLAGLAVAFDPPLFDELLSSAAA